MSHVFVSYKHEARDREMARRLVRTFRENGWKVWWDQDLPPGADYRAEIQRALDSAAAIVVLWSANPTSFVIEEAEVGKLRGVLRPVVIERAQPPLGFRGIQYSDLSDWSGDRGHPELRKLIRMLEGSLGRPSRPAPVEKRVQPTIETLASIAPASSRWKSPATMRRVAWSLGILAVVLAIALLVLRPTEPAQVLPEVASAAQTVPIRFESSPSGANVSVDGKAAGVTNFVAAYPLRTKLMVRFSMPGYEVEEVPYEVEERAPPCEVTLQPLARR
jgi:hypothetical protein